MGAAPPHLVTERARAMAGRVMHAARRHGVDERGARSVETAFRLAMVPRDQRLHDDHDPDYLHPGRTALTLIEDTGTARAAAIAAALLVETARPELRVARATGLDALGGEVWDLAEAVPLPEREGDTLLEALLVAPDDAALIALAERLDHARHLHLRPQSEWRTFHETIRAVYLPFADRTCPVLARRYRWWSDTFVRRFLRTDAHATQAP